MTDSIFIDAEKHFKKTILKDGIGDTPQLYREVFIFFAIRKQCNGGLIVGSELAPSKIQIGHGDTFTFIEEALKTMLLGERCLLEISEEYRKQQSKLSRFFTAEETGGIDAEIEIVRLGNYRNAPWELESDERITAASANKVKGNDFIKAKAKNYAHAATQYEVALKTIHGDFQVEELQTSLLSNFSLALLKTQKYAECITTATKVLEAAPTNIKVLFRRAQAHEGAGDFEKANEDLKSALLIDPTNQDVLNEIATIKNKQKQQLQKEKKVYANMFSNN